MLSAGVRGGPQPSAGVPSALASPQAAQAEAGGGVRQPEPPAPVTAQLGGSDTAIAVLSSDSPQRLKKEKAAEPQSLSSISIETSTGAAATGGAKGARLLSAALLELYSATRHGPATSLYYRFLHLLAVKLPVGIQQPPSEPRRVARGSPPGPYALALHRFDPFLHLLRQP